MLFGDPLNNRILIRLAGTREINYTYLNAAGKTISRIETRGKELLDPYLNPYGYEIYLHLYAMPTNDNLNCAIWLKDINLPFQDNWWLGR